MVSKKKTAVFRVKITYNYGKDAVDEDNLDLTGVRKDIRDAVEMRLYENEKVTVTRIPL